MARACLSGKRLAPFSPFISPSPSISRLEIPFPQNKRVLQEKPEEQFSKQVQVWLDSMDQQVHVHQLRQLLQTTTLNASESGLRALIMRHLRKSSKTTIDRDKIDFLLVQYFALCAPAKIYHKQIELIDVAQVMKPVLGDVDCTPLSWCEPLEKMILTLRAFKSLRDILKTNFIEQGRRVKEGAGGMFYDPAAMIAFVRFNFLLRRTLIELMHADLIYIRSGINHLETAGAKTVNCQAFGLSSTEPINKVRQIADEWKQPFQKEYNERSVNQAFEKLLALRSDVERTIERVIGKPIDASPSSAHSGLSVRLQSPLRLRRSRPYCNGEKSPAPAAAKACRRGACSRLRKLHGAGVGTVDFRSAVSWPLHDHRARRRRSLAHVFLGSRRLR